MATSRRLGIGAIALLAALVFLLGLALSGAFPATPTRPPKAG